MVVGDIRDEDFLKFREFFYRKTGIMFEDTKRYFVDRRLQERMVSTGSESFARYFMLLRFEPTASELQALTNLMTVNETYFFREDYQFRCLTESMLPDLVARRTDRKPIRIWSIPSSSGEEPYSIAIHLLENWPGIADWDVQIISSDIDTEMLGRARRGRYSARSVNNVSKPLLAKYFSSIGDEFQLRGDLLDAVEFTRVNLSDPAETAAYRDFDIVFCRNLLIYFDEVSRKAAVETFFEAMRPGAFICLGHSESMSRLSSLFSVRRFPLALVYQKPPEAR